MSPQEIKVDLFQMFFCKLEKNADDIKIHAAAKLTGLPTSPIKSNTFLRLLIDFLEYDLNFGIFDYYHFQCSSTLW